MLFFMFGKQLATIHDKNSHDYVYNILPVVQKMRSNKRISFHTGYDYEMNSHAMVRGNMKDINFDNIISAVNGQKKLIKF